MSAAVASRQSNTSSPLMKGNKSNTASPRTTKSALHNSETAKDSKDAKRETSVPVIKQPDNADSKPAKEGANAPLAPPPKPNQPADGEYFGAGAGATAAAGGPAGGQHLSKEPNPFENAFGNPSDETPGKPQLPGVTSLTSPASLLPGNTPGWPGSLRSGPLSPAMLTGPTGSSDYFNSDHHFPGSFPTPNESSLRTGLTPGGGGSMFPQPSPNSQAIFNSLQNGGATPGTLDFHRTAMTARAQTSANNYNVPTSQPGPTSNNAHSELETKSAFNAVNQPQPNTQSQDPFSSHQTNDAANGLFMLAQAGGQRGNASQPRQQANAQGYNHQGPPGVDAKPNGKSGNGPGASADGADQHSADEKPKVGRGKKGGAAAAATPAPKANKRKSTDGQPKGPAAKKAKASAQSSPQMDDDDDDDDDDMMGQDGGDDEELGQDGKRMTDEEKRKNFLERNRIAALKCRQRKKQWLASLQQKVEIFSTENDALAATVTQLREEIVGLKTLLLAHKDCPVSQAQGLSSMAIQQLAGDTSQHFAHPYGMGMHGPGGQMQPGMQRR